MHRAESILDAVVVALTGLGVTGNRVERERVYPPEQCPALSINQGAEEAINGRDNVAFQDSALEFEVIVQLKNDEPGTQLNTIKAEVYAALMANRQLGLPYVFDTAWQGDDKPEPGGDAETRTMRCRLRYAVAYRHALTSKET